jgi:hypothetical protein
MNSTTTTFSTLATIQIGLTWLAGGISLAGSISVFYIIRKFKTLLGWSLLLMNVFNLANAAFTIADLMAPGEDQGILKFFSILLSAISTMFYLYQVLGRLWLIPYYSRRVSMIQYIVFVLAGIFYTLSVICWIPTDLSPTTYLGCNSAINIILSIAGASQVILEIGNSIYVIFIISVMRGAENDVRYKDFALRRLPILISTIGLSIMTIIFLITGFPASYNTASVVYSLIIFVSMYYYSDFKDIIILGTSDHHSNSNNPHSPQSPRQASSDIDAHQSSSPVVIHLDMSTI